MRKMTDKAPLIAAIDVGTNSFHLIISSVNNREMMKVHASEKEVVRLGSSMKDMKLIKPDAFQRGIETMVKFNELAKSFNATVRAVATSAVREAKNKNDFVKAVFDQTGINIQVVSGAEEGRLIYIGAVHALPITNQRSLILDIGGGSTETIVGFENKVEFVASAKLGSIRMTRRFFDTDTVSADSIKECRQYIRGEWSPILKKIIETGFETVAGTSGTIQNIAAMTLIRTNGSAPDILNAVSLNRKDILETINIIASKKTTQERSQIPGMDPKRADIILGGALILEQAIIGLNIQKIVISTYALREGIVFDTYEQEQQVKTRKHLGSLRYDSIFGIAREYSVNLEHAEHIRKIALNMFDTLQPLHKLGYLEREYLEAAALLHDVGYMISYESHHKHSFYIITHCNMPGFTNDEKEVIAHIARYHRKSHPKKKHYDFNKLSLDHQYIVWVLGGILRIAEGIDRRQLHNVSDIDTSFSKVEILIKLIPARSEDNPDIELWGADRRKGMLEEVLGKKIRFEMVESE
jgi:exopolyphosphatase / guanosine-5'-triphosphate,3'-diphosphate pyrophosphatase